MDFIKNNKYIFLILLLAAVLLFVNLGKPDMEGDQAHYAFRSIGYMDYLASDKQTTPLQWSDEIPWWSKFSFHDHPPLVFLLQYFSIKTFGVSAFAARLPSALAGFLTIFLIYLIGQTLYSKQVGLLSAFILTISNYLIWISRTALLEAVMIFFITLSIYFFIKAWSNTKYLFFWGMALGLAFISKYIAFYLIPIYFLFILFKKRSWLKEKNFWLSLVLIILICSPVIVYNLMMFSTRGHFDMQFAALFGQGNTDWPLIQRALNFNFKGLLINNFNALKSVYSPISLLLFIFALSFFVWQRNNQHKFFLIISVIFVLIGVTILGSGDRYLSVISIYLALIAGFFLNALLKLFNHQRVFKFLLPLLFLFLSVDLLYTVNNNILPISISKKLELPTRASWVGYNRLDKYFQDEFENQCSNHTLARGPFEKNIIQKFIRGEECDSINNQSFIIYDDKINWFETIWIFDRLRIYQGIPTIHAEALGKMISEKSPTIDFINKFSEFYFVSLEDLSIVDKYSSGDFDFFENQILSQIPDIQPEIIKGYDDSISFRIYKLKQVKF